MYQIKNIQLMLHIFMEYNKFETIKSNKLLTLETDDSTQREIGALDVVAGCLFYTHC